MTTPKPMDARKLPGVSFVCARNGHVRYIYPQSPQWGGWLLVQKKDGTWMSLRKASDADIAVINKTVVESFHQGGAK